MKCKNPRSGAGEEEERNPVFHNNSSDRRVSMRDTANTRFYTSRNLDQAITNRCEKSLVDFHLLAVGDFFFAARNSGH